MESQDQSELSYIRLIANYSDCESEHSTNFQNYAIHKRRSEHSAPINIRISLKNLINFQLGFTFNIELLKRVLSSIV